MAKYKIQSPDGETYEITAPDSATEQEVLEYAKQQFGQKLQDAETKSSQSQMTHSLPQKDGSALRGLAKGVMRAQVQAPLAISDLLQLSEIPAIRKLATEKVSPFLRNADEYWKPKDAGEASGATTGMVAGTLVSLPALASTKIPVATSMIGRAGQGAAIGNLFGAMTPVPKEQQKDKTQYISSLIKQSLPGALLGGGIPVGAAAVKGTYNVAKDLTRLAGGEKGQEKLYLDYINYIIGKDPAAKQEIINLLRSADSPIEGYARTAGQKVATSPIGSPLIAVEDKIKQSLGGSVPFGIRKQAQNQALGEHFNKIGSVDDIAALEAKRTADAAAGYTPELMSRQIPVQGQLTQLMQRPSMQQARGSAVNRVLEQQKGALPSDEVVTVANLQAMREGLARQAKDPNAFGLPGADARDIISTRNELTNLMPDDWRLVNDQYAQQSKNLAQMEVAQILKNKLLPGTGNIDDAMAAQKEAAYLNAVRNMNSEVGNLPSITNKLNQPRYSSLDKLMEPNQMNVINEATDEITRNSLYKAPWQKTNLASGEQQLSQSHGLLPSMFERSVVITNWMIKKFGQNVADEVNSIAAKYHLNPEMLANALVDKTPSQAAQYLNAIRQGIVNPALGTIGTVGAGVTQNR